MVTKLYDKMPAFFSCGAAAQHGPWPPHSQGF